MKGGLHQDFYIPTEIFIKQDIITDIGSLLKTYGSKIILITTYSDYTKFEDVIESINKSAKHHGIGCIIYDEIPDNPDTDYVDSAVYFAKKTNCDTVIGFGGIDSINVAKAVSLLISNYLFCEDLFEHLLLDAGQFLGIDVVVRLAVFIHNRRDLADETGLQEKTVGFFEFFVLLLL